MPDTLFNIIDVFFFDWKEHLILFLRLAIDFLADPLLISLVVPGVAVAEMLSMGEDAEASPDALVMVVIASTWRKLSYPWRKTVLTLLGLLTIDVLENYFSKLD